MSIADREREIRTQLQKDICTILSEKGHRVQDKNVTFFLIFGYRPKFHLKYCVYLNNWSGHPSPQGNTPSFLVNLDGILTVEEQVKNILKGVVPLVRNLGPQ